MYESDSSLDEKLAKAQEDRRNALEELKGMVANVVDASVKYATETIAELIVKKEKIDQEAELLSSNIDFASVLLKGSDAEKKIKAGQLKERLANYKEELSSLEGAIEDSQDPDEVVEFSFE